MNIEEFRERAHEIIDYIVDYLDSISERRVTPNVFPGFLMHLLPSTAPKTGESFETIMQDFETYIMPGITHWQHPRFHAYFPATCSFPSILAEMLSDTIGNVGFNWSISPCGSELETIVLDWIAERMDLPKEFRYAEGSKGSGFVQTSASECVVINMIAARNEMLQKLQNINPSLSKAVLLSSLVGYCSKEAHSCVMKAGIIAVVSIKVLETDETYRLRGTTLANAVEEDKKNGLVPFFTTITLGTTSCCSCDPIYEIGPICKANDMWLHIDAAYSGNAMICPEFRHFLNGIEYASSFNFNPIKWMLVNIDCSIMWVKDRFKINETILTDQTYFDYDYGCRGYPSNKRFIVLKLWFVIRTYGIEGLQRHIRKHIQLAKIFEAHVREDDRFEVISSQFALVCFRLKGSNMLNKKLVMAINASGKLHITACSLNKMYIIRFCVCVEHANEDDISYAWSVFTEFTEELLLQESRRHSI